MSDSVEGLVDRLDPLAHAAEVAVAVGLSGARQLAGQAGGWLEVAGQDRPVRPGTAGRVPGAGCPESAAERERRDNMAVGFRSGAALGLIGWILLVHGLLTAAVGPALGLPA